MCEIYSELTIKVPKRREWRRSSVFIDTFGTDFIHCSGVILIHVDTGVILLPLIL